MRPNPTTDCSSHFNGDRILLLEYFFSCIEKGAQYGHVTRHKLNRKNKSCGTNIRLQLNRCQNTNSAKPNFLYSMEIAPPPTPPPKIFKRSLVTFQCAIHKIDGNFLFQKNAFSKWWQQRRTHLLLHYWCRLCCLHQNIMILIQQIYSQWSNSGRSSGWGTRFHPAPPAESFAGVCHAAVY